MFKHSIWHMPFIIPMSTYIPGWPMSETHLTNGLPRPLVHSRGHFSLTVFDNTKGIYLYLGCITFVFLMIKLCFCNRRCKMQLRGRYVLRALRKQLLHLRVFPNSVRRPHLQMRCLLNVQRWDGSVWGGIASPSKCRFEYLRRWSTTTWILSITCDRNA